MAKIKENFSKKQLSIILKEQENRILGRVQIMNRGGYIRLIVQDEFGSNITSVDFLNFNSKKKYSDQINEYVDKTGQKSAVKTITGKVGGFDVVLAVMNFNFIGGSMGSVVGHKISLAVDKAYEQKCPLIIVTASPAAKIDWLTVTPPVVIVIHLPASPTTNV